MLQRTLKYKENIEHMIDQVIGHIKQLEAVHGVAPKTSLELEEAKADAHKLSLVESIPEVANVLAKMNLAFLCTKNKRVSYITSDAPPICSTACCNSELYATQPRPKVC